MKQEQTKIYSKGLLEFNKKNNRKNSVLLLLLETTKYNIFDEVFRLYYLK
jgi:hypothetical protein